MGYAIRNVQCIGGSELKGFEAERNDVRGYGAMEIVQIGRDGRNG